MKAKVTAATATRTCRLLTQRELQQLLTARATGAQSKTKALTDLDHGVVLQTHLHPNAIQLAIRAWTPPVSTWRPAQSEVGTITARSETAKGRSAASPASTKNHPRASGATASQPHQSTVASACATKYQPTVADRGAGPMTP